MIETSITLSGPTIFALGALLGALFGRIVTFGIMAILFVVFLLQS